MSRYTTTLRSDAEQEQKSECDQHQHAQARDGLVRLGQHETAGFKMCFGEGLSEIEEPLRHRASNRDSP